MTKFATEEIDVGNELSLHIDGNSKITAGNGGFDNPRPNAFSLPHISTCPGATKVCLSSCYVNGLSEKETEIYDLYRHNERTMHRILMGDGRSYAKKLGRWISENCKGGFRWHVSGDVFSERYAQWIVHVCLASREVDHWIYTRNLAAVPTFGWASNLSVNISVDDDNATEAFEVADENSRRVAYMATGDVSMGLQSGDVIFPTYELRNDPEWFESLTQEQRKMVCPADFFGQSEHHRCGPCQKCMK